MRGLKEEKEGIFMEKLKFYDVKARKAFQSSSYSTVKKGGRCFAVAKAPSGIRSFRIMGKKC
jgi:hypothetical protein